MQQKHRLALSRNSKSANLWLKSPVQNTLCLLRGGECRCTLRLQTTCRELVCFGKIWSSRTGKNILNNLNVGHLISVGKSRQFSKIRVYIFTGGAVVRLWWLEKRRSVGLLFTVSFPTELDGCFASKHRKKKLKGIQL